MVGQNTAYRGESQSGETNPSKVCCLYPKLDYAGQSWIGLNLDVEERKLAEFYLAEGQRLAHMGSWAFNAAGFDYWSSELFQIHGLDPSGRPPTVEEYLDLVHSKDRGFMKQVIDKMFADHRGFDVTNRIVRPDGEVRSVRCVGIPVIHGATFQGFLGTGMDVTEQEQLTQELQRREALLAAENRLLEMIATGTALEEILNALCQIIEEQSSGTIASVLLLDPDGAHLRVVAAPKLPNQWTQQMERLPIGPCAGSCGTAAYRRSLVIVSDIASDPLWNVPEHRDSALKHGLRASWSSPVLSSNGNVLGTFCMYYRERRSPGARDLDLIEAATHLVKVAIERDRAEEGLRRSEAYLAEAQAISHTGSFGCKASSGEMFWSEETFRIFGYDRSAKPTVEAILKRVHPDDKATVQGHIDSATGQGKDCNLEYRLLLPDDSVKHVHVVAHAVKDKAGNLEFVGAVTDVTEREAAEDRIRGQEAELRQMLDFAPQHIAVFGPGRERLYANRPLLDYLGLTLEVWRQRLDRDEFVHPDDWERVNSHFDRARSTGAAFEWELRLCKGDGSYRWFLARCNPVCDDDGRVRRWYVACTDIEDRKRAEEKLQLENVALREEIDKASMFEEIVGASPALQTVFSRISKVARSESTVLITGETGTGKELVARAIHRRSNRASRAFVSVNCAAIPRDLIASELFGHEKGAFTGASQQRLGRFELANGGTIFLDEVGELPAETQVALLRVLQEHEFERVGGTRQIHADVRVIAATNRDLQAAIRAGSFRSDLFYRLDVFPINIPPLRERKDDIRLLVEYFIDRYARKAGKNITSVCKKTFRLLESYPWPGNIRELQNVVERSVILCETGNLSVDESWLSQQPAEGEMDRLCLSGKVAAQEKEIIEAALLECQGRVFGQWGAAAKLGIARSTLESKIQSLKINKNRFRV